MRLGPVPRLYFLPLQINNTAQKPYLRFETSFVNLFRCRRRRRRRTRRRSMKRQILVTVFRV